MFSPESNCYRAMGTESFSCRRKTARPGGVQACLSLKGGNGSGEFSSVSLSCSVVTYQWYEMYHSKHFSVCSSLALGAFTMPCNPLTPVHFQNVFLIPDWMKSISLKTVTTPRSLFSCLLYEFDSSASGKGNPMHLSSGPIYFLSVMFSGCVHVGARVRISFLLRLNAIPWCGCFAFCLSVPLLADARVVAAVWPLWPVLPHTLLHTYLFESLPSFLWKVLLEVELRGQVVGPCVTFWVATKPVPTAAERFHVPTRGAPAFQFLNIFANAC